MPDLKLYTIADLREWLVANNAPEGLSERIIAPARAWAILHNPYVQDSDPVVAAIFEDGCVAAYSASFPDKLDGQRVWWASTLYCYPQFLGRGYGLAVLGSLKEAHEPELTYDRWGASETVEIFNHFGYQTTYTIRYHLSDGKIDVSSFKGKLAYCAQELKKCIHPWSKVSEGDYSIHYASLVDGEAYAFIKAHKGTNLWLREQGMFNWILSHPFVNVGSKKEGECVFGAAAKVYGYKVAKVYVKGNLCGVYILRQHDDVLSVIYLYYTYEQRDVVFDSIIDQVVDLHPKSFMTENKKLYKRVRESLYFPKMQEEKVSFSFPDIKNNLTEFTLQLGDGDSFA